MPRSPVTTVSLSSVAAAAAVLVVCGWCCAQEANVEPDAIMLSPDAKPEEIIAQAARVVPAARQLAWQELEFAAFVHFGMNTFTDREWGDGKEDPKLFNPAQFDGKQWAKVCKDAGMRELILTCKHHDGFCLWPSKYTEHCVKNSPWKSGKGDIVREVADACREAGIKLGVYLSPWDRHEQSYGDSPKYNEYFKNQLRELLSNYGPVQEVWFDGACGEGPNGKRQVYDWPAYYAVIRELQPNAVITVCGPDVRWCGNEAGHVRESEWSVVPIVGADDQPWERSEKTLKAILDMGAHGGAQQADIGSRGKLLAAAKKGGRLIWYPSQVNTSIRPGWFYHAGEDNRVKPLEQLLNIYYGSVGGNAQFLLNLPPDRRGLIHENDAARLRDMRKVLDATFATDLAKGAAAKAAADGGATVVEYDLSQPRTFNRALLQEDTKQGQRVEEFFLEMWDGKDWKQAARATVIGYKRLLRFDDVTAQKVRVRIAQSRAQPALSSFGLFRGPPILSAPAISRDKQGLVTLSAAPGVEIRYWLLGPHATPSSVKYAEPFALPLGRTVKALAIAPDGSQCITLGESTLNQAEFGIAKGKWKIAYVDSEEAPSEAAANAIDDNPKTIWHSEWKKKQPPCPHEIQVDLGETVEMAGFTYLPRDNAQDGGSICSKYEFYASADGKDWGKPLAAGEFGNIRNNPVLQTVKFEKPVTARFVRFVAVAECKGAPYVSMAELGVVPVIPKPLEGKAPTAGWVDLKPATVQQSARLLNAPERVNDRFPLSDQENKSGWAKYEPMSDEFNGDKLDEAKWWPNNPTWKGRYPGLFRKENVTVSDGQLHLTMKKEPIPAIETDKKYKDYTCAAVQSKDTVRYGYFEVRSRAMKSAGSSSFWFYHSTKPWWTEIDVYEIGGKTPGKERWQHITMHVFHTPNETKHWQVGSHFLAPANLCDDYHVFGLEWDEQELKFYFDGVLVRKGPNTHWHQPLTLNFDSETMPDWLGMPKDEDLPSTFSVEYVRAWKRK